MNIVNEISRCSRKRNFEADGIANEKYVSIGRRIFVGLVMSNHPVEKLGFGEDALVNSVVVHLKRGLPHPKEVGVKDIVAPEISRLSKKV